MPRNSNVYFGEITGTELKYNVSITREKHGLSATVNLYNEQFNFPAFNIFSNSDYAKLTTYGLTFRVCELLDINVYELKKLIKDHFGIFNYDNKILRIDYKFDIFGITPEEFYTLLKKRNYKKNKRTGKYYCLVTQKSGQHISTETITRDNRKYINHGQANTFYVGSRKTNYTYCRIYNKTLDNIRCKKENYYLDYDTPTTRVEFYFGGKFIGEKGIKETLEHIKEYIGLDKLKKENFFKSSKYNKNYILAPVVYQNMIRNGLLKLISNGFDLSQDFNYINQKQKMVHLTYERLKLHKLIYSSELDALARHHQDYIKYLHSINHKQLDKLTSIDYEHYFFDYAKSLSKLP